MSIPLYPEFQDISLEMRKDLYPALNLSDDGISEFTFSNLYLFRHAYLYRLSRIPGRTFILSGVKNGEKFCVFPCDFPGIPVVEELLQSHDYVKNLSERLTEKHRIELEQKGFRVVEDRDNFDYLYLRKDLAELSGKHYHKKRNLVNAFLNSYTYSMEPLRRERLGDAVQVLEKWREQKGEDGDYRAAKEGLELFEDLGMRGCLYYVGGNPAGYVLGEPLARGRMFAVHFEKGLEAYKGIYQFINQAFAEGLPRYITHVNREQDLGNEGLRQAKMTYRPCGFIKKYRVYKSQA